MSILSVFSGIAKAIACYFKLKASANRQRREAEKDVSVKEAEIKAKTDEIKDAVYTANDSKLNEIVICLMQTSVAILVAVFVGCAPRPKTVYIPTDRKIESCTNSIGIPCKAVPDPVMVEILDKLNELKELKYEMKVDKRVLK